MWVWSLVLGVGLILLIVGVVFFARKIGGEGAVKVGWGKFAVENATHAALVFVSGVALFVLGAWRLDDGTETPEKVSRPDPPAGPLFADRFETKKLDESWQVISGAWRVEAGKLVSRGRAADVKRGREWALLTLDRTLPRDYTLSARTRIVKGNLAELMVRLARGQYVRVYLYDIDQDVVLGKGTFIEREAPGELSPEEVADSLGGGESLVEKGFPVRIGIWYRLRVTVRDDRYEVSVGGQQLIDFRDRRGQLSRQGTIGLISNGEVEFDDVIVKRPP